MIVMRRVKIEVNRPKIGDRIRVGHYTATCQEITPKGALFLLDQYLDKPMVMNVVDTNKGGYPESDLRKALQSKEVLNIFADIRDHMIPFENGDLLRIPFAGEMFGDEVPQWIESDSNEQWPLMKDAHNRAASRCGEPGWGWLANTFRDTSTNFCAVHYGGIAANWYASNVLGVRPVFQIAEEGKAKIHQLKILDCFADEIIAGNKMFELRKNDRDYQKGDYICFTVISDESEREIKHAINTRLYEITCVLSGWGLMDGYVALGIREAGWDEREMQLIERIEITKPMESKYIRADLLMNKIAESAFFSAAEKGKIRAAIENEPSEDVKPVVHAHWIRTAIDDGNKGYIRCSNCGADFSLPVHKMQGFFRGIVARAARRWTRRKTKHEQSSFNGPTDAGS